MADKAISELLAASQVTPTDLFVLEQSGTAKKLTGQVLENWLVSLADGHGGIQSMAKVSTSGLVDTYRITLADTTTFDFLVTNGKSINSITKTGTSGLVDTYTIRYNDSTSGTFTVTNGAKGDKGDNQYVWIKYASQQPTASSHSFGDVPDAWIGFYSGASSTAPTDWQEYSWYQIKGEKGDTGAAATVSNNVVEYQVGDSGTIIPSGSWGTSIPVVAQGKYLWTRTTTTFNTGSPAVSYSVSRMGMDGTGSVTSVGGISPDANGNVPLKPDDIAALPIAGGTMSGGINMNGQTLNGLNAPTADDEAATKGYSDSQITDRVIYSGGKNLIDTSYFIPNASTDFVVQNGESIKVYNEENTMWSGANTINKVKLKAGHKYILSANILAYTGNEARVTARLVGDHPDFSLGNDKILFYASANVIGRSSSAVYTPPTDLYVRIAIFATGNTASIGSIEASNIMLEENTVATNFEPYYDGLAELTKGSTLLWENATPTEVFVEQEFVLPITDLYKLFVVEYNLSTTSNTKTTHLTSYGFTRAHMIENGGSSITTRAVNFARTTPGISVHFWSAYTGNSDKLTDVAIPTKIYGIK